MSQALSCLVKFGWVDVCGMEWSDGRNSAGPDWGARRGGVCVEGAGCTLEWSLTGGWGAAAGGAREAFDSQPSPLMSLMCPSLCSHRNHLSWLAVSDLFDSPNFYFTGCQKGHRSLKTAPTRPRLHPTARQLSSRALFQNLCPSLLKSPPPSQLSPLPSQRICRDPAVYQALC